MGGVLGVFKSDRSLELVANFDPAAFDSTDAQGNAKSAIDQVTEILSRKAGILTDLKEYKPRSDFIRKAMSDPTEANEREAFTVVTRNAEVIASFWRYSKELEDIFPQLLQLLAGSDDPSPAVSKKVAEVLDFVLKFDELKMLQPGLQNDFAFYRRQLSKHAGDADLVVRDDDASFISLFLAAHIPMMACLAKATSSVYRENENITVAVASFANTCFALVKHHKFEPDSANIDLCLRGMAGAIILYDHVEAEGAFVKRSPIFMKGAALLLTRDFPKEYPRHPSTDSLISAIRFSSMHFNDESTPAYLVDILDV